MLISPCVKTPGHASAIAAPRGRRGITAQPKTATNVPAPHSAHHCSPGQSLSFCRPPGLAVSGCDQDRRGYHSQTVSLEPGWQTSHIGSSSAGPLPRTASFYESHPIGFQLHCSRAGPTARFGLMASEEVASRLGSRLPGPWHVRHQRIDPSDVRGRAQAN
jgi:hypothetical protein